MECTATGHQAHGEVVDRSPLTADVGHRFVPVRLGFTAPRQCERHCASRSSAGRRVCPACRRSEIPTFGPCRQQLRGQRQPLQRGHHVGGQHRQSHLGGTGSEASARHHAGPPSGRSKPSRQSAPTTFNTRKLST